MIRGFITNLAKYLDCELVGQWIDFPIDEDELAEVLEEIGINEEHEEFFFTNWETDYPEITKSLGQFESIEDVNDWAEGIDFYDASFIAAIIEATGCDLQEALDNADNVTFYEGYTLEEVAENIVEDCYDLPEIAERYFDYEAFARDLGYDGYTETKYGTVYIS